MSGTREKFSKVFERVGLPDDILKNFENSFVTRITVNKDTMVMAIWLENVDIIPKSTEASLKEAILSEFRSLLGVELNITYNLPAEEIFGDAVDAEEIVLNE